MRAKRLHAVPSQPLVTHYAFCGLMCFNPDLGVNYFYSMTHTFKFANILAITFKLPTEVLALRRFVISLIL